MKLPQIQFQRVSAPNTIGPGAAVANYRAKQGVLESIQKLGAQVAEEKVEYDTNKANSSYADEISQFKRSMATKIDFTADQIESMGLDDVVDTTNPETGERLASIPKYKVYAIALERQMEDARNRYGADISNTKYRSAWQNAVAADSRAELDKAVADSAKMANEYETGAMLVDIDNAINSGQFQTARDLIATNPRLKSILTPEKMNEIKTNITTAEVEAGFRNELDGFVESGDLAGMEEFGKMLKSDEANAKYGTMDDKQLNAWGDNFIATANTARNQAKTNETRVYNAGINQYWADYDQRPEELVANMPRLHAMLPGGLKDEDRRAIYSFADKQSKGESVTTNVATWSMLETMKVSEKDSFRNLNLLQYRDQLSISDYKSLYNDQIELIEQHRGTGEPPTYLTNESVFNLGLSRLGINTTGNIDAEERHEMKSIFAVALSDAESAKGRKLSDQEKTDVISDVVMFEITSRGKKRNAMPFKDMSNEDIVEINSVLRENNVDVNAINAASAKALMKKNIDVSERNIAIANELLKHGQIVTEKSIAKFEEELRMRGL